MKRLITILIAITTIFACTPKEKDTLITGTIENPVTKTFEITYHKDFVTFDIENHEITLDENNSFIFKLDIKNPVNAQIVFESGYNIELFIEPGDELHITADYIDIINTISFEGNNADNNYFINKYEKELKDKYRHMQIISKIRESNPEEFVDFANNMLNYKKQLYKDISRDKNLSDVFEHFFKTNIRYSYFEYMINYPLYHKALNQLDEDPELPEGYFAFIEDALQLSDDKLLSPNYCNFLSSYIGYYKNENPDKVQEEKPHFETNMHFADKLYEGKTKDHIKATYIYREFNFGNFDLAEEFYKSFIADEPCKKYIDILAPVYKEVSEIVERLSPGNPAPEFELTDIDGNKVSLSDFRGKVVYLDFWASWCPPCMREVPYAKKLKERFDNEEDLVFLYVSVDEDKDAWRNTIENKQIKGVHLNVQGRDNEITNDYNVKGIPTYFIIDRDGLIFDNNAKRPSHEEIDKDLMAALEKGLS